jgi:AhpD family alkylhydroperoxidase
MPPNEEPPKPRLSYVRIAPDARAAIDHLGQYLAGSAIEPSLRELVFLRASMLNGCAFCIQDHTKAAMEHGERAERIFQLDAWAESPAFTPREKAALAWTDALTLIRDGHAPDATFALAKSQFNDKELVDLSWAVAYINVWNRMSIAFRGQPRLTPPAAPTPA